MAHYEHLPIYKKMLDLTVFMENTVRNFSRYHKYTLGGELRTMCHEALGLIMEANTTKNRADVLARLRVLVERIKIHLVLAKEVKAFNNPNSFVTASELAVNVG